MHAVVEMDAQSVCHALHGNGLSCITREEFVMHYTTKVYNALPVKGLSCITREGFVMHYTTKVYCTLL